MENVSRSQNVSKEFRLRNNELYKHYESEKLTGECEKIRF